MITLGLGVVACDADEDTGDSQEEKCDEVCTLLAICGEKDGGVHGIMGRDRCMEDCVDHKWSADIISCYTNVAEECVEEDGCLN